jgi:hypothetical protein
MGLPASARPADLLPARLHLAARATYLLLNVDQRGDVETFVTHTLGRLLRQLNHNTQQQQIEVPGRVRGRVVWSATYKARYAQDYDPTRYICREVRHLYDTPENQLLKYVVEQVTRWLKAVPKALQAGACYISAEDERRPLLTATRLARMELTLNALRYHRRLQDVTLPASITPTHLLRAENARLEEYADVARIYTLCQATVASPAWDAVMAIGRHALPLPGGVAPESDMWIRFGACMLRASH